MVCLGMFSSKMFFRKVSLDCEPPILQPTDYWTDFPFLKEALVEVLVEEKPSPSEVGQLEIHATELCFPWGLKSWQKCWRGVLSFAECGL